MHTMLTLQERLKREVRFIAVDHTDQKGTDLRHSHVLALVTTKLFIPDLQALTHAATEAAVFQREDLDRGLVQDGLGRKEAAPSRQASGETPTAKSEGQAKPTRIAVTCPSCASGQRMKRVSRTLYRCPACSLQFDHGSGRAVSDLEL